MRYRRLVASVCLVIAGACSDGSGPTDQSTTAKPTFATGSPASFTAVYPGGNSCQNGPGVVNCNLYQAKADVALNAGPSGANLDDGTYFFAVLAPSGQSNPNDGGTGLLSSDPYTDRDFTISGGTLSYPGPHAITGDLIQLIPFADTPNNGGVYILAICRIGDGYDPATAPVDPSTCKYDAFKVSEDVCTGDCTGGDPDGTLAALKYYDANANGVKDGSEQYITGWLMQLYLTSPFVNLLDDKLTPAEWSLEAGDYTVVEGTPIQSNWFHTDPSTAPFQKSATVVSGETVTVEFGNVCVGAGGGLTLGFWSNKNGQALISAPDLALLVSLNLRNANGTNFDPANYAAFRTWLLSANATNMAYMLSAQLAAMELNVFNGQVTGSTLIYAPGTTSANTLGFATVNDVMAEANTELGAHNITVAAGANRTYQEALKNALDRANNNLNFVRATPCAFSFAAAN